MCKKCGCNTCETESTALILNESKAPRAILSEGLKHHIDTNKPLTEHLYRAGSRAYFDLFAEARSLYSRGILEFTHEDDVALLTETNLGHFGMFEGKKVPLDFPMLEEESNMPSQEEVDKFFSITQNEMHYLNSKPVMGQEKTFNKMKVEPWDEYDLSNWNALVRKAKAQGKINENNLLKQAKLSSEEYQKAKKLKGFNADDYTFSSDNNLYVKEKKSKFKKHGEMSGFDMRGINEGKIDRVVGGRPYDYVGDGRKGQAIVSGPMKDREKEAIIKRAKEAGYIAKPNMGGGVTIQVESLNEEMGEWPKELTSRYSDEYRFELEKVTPTYQDKPGRAKYRVIDIESGELKGTPVFGTPESLMAFADDLIKPQGGTQSSNFGESLKERIVNILEAKAKKKDNRPIGKPMRDTSGGKAYKVYVKDPKTKKVKTVRFGSGGLRAKINDSKARAAFAARHKCSTKKDKTKAGYWSCRLPRYAKLLGLKSSFSGFW